MVHSVELVFDPDTEAAIRHIWDGLREAGIPVRRRPSRPHATLTVAERIDPEVDELLRSLRGAVAVAVPDRRAAVVRRAKVVLARLVVPTAALLDVHADVHRLCLPHLRPVRWRTRCPASGPRTSHWPAASCPPSWAGRCGSRGSRRRSPGSVVGLRRWDGNAKRRVPDHVLRY